MLPEKRIYASSMNNCTESAKNSMFFAEETPEGTDQGLEETVRQEQEYLRQRLRDELKREPTEKELNDWLRQHTEGY